MSWPTDGEPRFVTGCITGGDMTDGVRNLPEWYIYDRAFCSRIVYRRSAGGKKGVVAARVEERCRVLNDVAESYL